MKTESLMNTVARAVGLRSKPALVATTRKKARAAHSYRGFRRNFARRALRAFPGLSWRDSLTFAFGTPSTSLREFAAANPKATGPQLAAAWEALSAPPAAEPAEAPKAKKPRAPRKPAVPKDATAQAAPKAPRKTAAKKPSDAPAKPKAAPRKRALAAA